MDLDNREEIEYRINSCVEENQEGSEIFHIEIIDMKEDIDNLKVQFSGVLQSLEGEVKTFEGMTILWEDGETEILKMKFI